MPPTRIWKAVLRCHACRRVFTLSGLLANQIPKIQSTRICPHCAAIPVVVRGSFSKSRVHHLIGLKEEPPKNH